MGGTLVSQRPHHPPGNDQSAHEHGEAVQSVTDLFAKSFAQCNSKYHRREK